jgi:hypothetical protein
MQSDCATGQQPRHQLDRFMCNGGLRHRFGTPSLANTCRRWVFTVDSRLATAPFARPQATKWRGNDDDGEHIEQFPAEDGSRAKVTAKPGTPGSDPDRENPYAAATELLNMRAVRWPIAPAIDRAESAIWSSTGRHSDHAQRLPLVPAAMRYPPICPGIRSTVAAMYAAQVRVFCVRPIPAQIGSMPLHRTRSGRGRVIHC